MMKLGILKEFLNEHEKYIKACEDLNIEYEVIDIISSDWLRNVKDADCDGLLVRPSYKKEVWKTMYTERLYFLNKILNIPIYPSYNEILVYENKKNMAYWLETYEIKHPKTWIFYSKKEALMFADAYDHYPLVFKTNIGSAAIGVEFVKTKEEAKKIISKMFTTHTFYNRGYTKWKKTKYGLSVPLMDDKQYNYVIFQEKIDVKTEWRMIKIGDSYFGHQKLSDGEFHSGSNLVGWVEPPERLLDFAKEICDKGDFRSMDIDVFEDAAGTYHVNELQTVFGSYDDSQMYIDGIPGRFIHENGKWEFEKGYYNQNGSNNLRVADFVSLLQD